MASKKLTPKQQNLFGWFAFLTGLPFIGMAFGLVQVDESTVHAPLWVIGLCGFVFSLGGIMMLLGEKSHINNLLGGLLVLSFAAIGGWVALFGDAAQFSGGSAFLSDTQNVRIARLMFGIGSLLCFTVAIHAFRLQLKSNKKPKE